MKAINAYYNVRGGYWASRNNVQEYKVYVVVIQMFNLDFVNTLREFPRDKFLETIHGQSNRQTTTIGPVYYANQNNYWG
jgi:hypothetical protein